MSKEVAISRIEKAEATIAKKQNTIAKKQKQIEKKLAELAKMGITFEREIHHTNELDELGYNREDSNTIYWLECDINSLQSDIRRGEKEIAEKEAKLPEYRKALEEAEQCERILANDIPESLRTAKETLVDNWTAWDIAERNQMYKDSKELDYKEFYKKWKYSEVDRLRKSDEELRKANDKDATLWLLDLYNRVKEITGDITDASHVRWGGKALNGYITGKNGTAEVFTIEAGGYNIQRWHLRVLVKSR